VTTVRDLIRLLLSRPWEGDAHYEFAVMHGPGVSCATWPEIVNVGGAWGQVWRWRCFVRGDRSEVIEIGGTGRHPNMAKLAAIREAATVVAKQRGEEIRC
jgi:hypothetical protein